MPIHPNNQKYKDEILTAPYEICIERARYYTEIFKSTEGEHPALRMARAFAHTLRNMTIYIRDGEEIVGNRSSKLVGAVLAVERGDTNAVLDMDLDILTTRRQQPYRISDDEKKELQQDILPYWRGRTVRDKKKILWRRHGLDFQPALHPASLVQRYRSLDIRRMMEFTSMPRLSGSHVLEKLNLPVDIAGGRMLDSVTFPRVSIPYIFKSLGEVLHNNPALFIFILDMQGHLILGHRNVLGEGFSGIKKRAEKRLAKARRDNDAEGMTFLEAVIISCDAIRDFSARFADEALRLAQNQTDPARRESLAQIAEHCRHVPYHPPRTFHEAVQAVWLTQAGAIISHGLGAFALGRIDQYLYPFYEKDKSEGRITEQKAVKLLEELLLKLSYNLTVLPHAGKNTSSELGLDINNPTIGGLDTDGNDAVNELSYLVLEAFTNVKSTCNSFTIRLSKKSPELFWKKTLETFRRTSGAALYNDDVAIPALENSGVTEEDARNYGVIGCVEPTGDGDTFGVVGGNHISLAAALEMSLLDGRLRIMGKRIGPRSGDTARFRTYDRLLRAFKKQAVFLIDTCVRAANLKDQVYMEEFPYPYVSCTLTGCVDNARDMAAGGARYNFNAILVTGLGTVVDSLAAVKRFVFEEKKYSPAQLIGMLNSNFKGHKSARATLARRAPKYGSDQDDADSIAQEIAAFLCHEIAARKNIRNGPYRPCFLSAGMNVADGLFLGATPDGRRAGEPVSNGISPANGSERHGPTAMLRSVSKIDHSLISNGCALNIKLNPSMFRGEERLSKMVTLVKSFFSLGGMEMQPNVVSNRILRDAQKHPEKYRDLVVRISGYSAYFNDLGKPLQDDIINRTEFCNL